MQVYFLVTLISGKTKRFKLGDGEFVIIGRNAQSCQVQIDDEQCSSTHCKIFLKDQEIYIEDLDSKNGVYLNKVRVLKQRVYLEDRIQIGDIPIKIDETRLDEKQMETLSYQGEFTRGAGNITLELNPQVGLSNKSASSYNKPAAPIIKDVRKRAYAKERISEKKRMSKSKKQTLQYFAFLVDLAISIAAFFILINLTKGTAQVSSELETKRSFLTLVFSGDIQYQVIISIFLSIVLLGINRNLPKGSIGEQLFKIN